MLNSHVLSVQDMIKKCVFIYHLHFHAREGILILQLHSLLPELLPPLQYAAPRSRTKTTFIFFRKKVATEATLKKIVSEVVEAKGQHLIYRGLKGI